MVQHLTCQKAHVASSDCTWSSWQLYQALLLHQGGRQQCLLFAVLTRANAGGPCACYGCTPTVDCLTAAGAW